MKIIQSKEYFPDPTQAKMDNKVFHWAIPIFMLVASIMLCFGYERVGTDITIAASMLLISITKLVRKPKIQRSLMFLMFIVTIGYTFFMPTGEANPFTVICLMTAAVPFIFKAPAIIFQWYGKTIAIVGETAILGHILHTIFPNVETLERMYFTFYTHASGHHDGMPAEVAFMLILLGYWIHAYHGFKIKT